MDEKPRTSDKGHQIGECVGCYGDYSYYGYYGPVDPVKANPSKKPKFNQLIVCVKCWKLLRFGGTNGFSTPPYFLCHPCSTRLISNDQIKTFQPDPSRWSEEPDIDKNTDVDKNIKKRTDENLRKAFWS